MASEKQTAAKIVKLLAVAKELHAKQGEILEEIDALLEGKAGVAELLKLAEKAYGDAWRVRYASAYLWRFQVDRPNMKRLLKAMTPAEIERRAVEYLADGDPFLVRARHPFGLFVSRINQYAAAGASREFELQPVADCRHVPACASDQEHTRRKLAEMRA